MCEHELDLKPIKEKFECFIQKCNSLTNLSKKRRNQLFQLGKQLNQLENIENIYSKLKYKNISPQVAFAKASLELTLLMIENLQIDANIIGNSLDLISGYIKVLSDIQNTSNSEPNLEANLLIEGGTTIITSESTKPPIQSLISASLPIDIKSPRSHRLSEGGSKLPMCMCNK